MFTTALAGLGHIGPNFGAAGARTEKVTSGGMDNGARPIWDGRDGVLEKHLVLVDARDGRRNAGRVVEGAEAIARSRTFDRVVESIALGVMVL